MKKFLKITGAIVLVLLLVLVGGGWYFASQIKPLIISQLNEQLQVKVEVAEVKISKLTSFPKLGIRFTEVKIHESQAHFNAPMLEANELNLYVNLFKLAKKEYQIEGLSLTNGAIRMADLEEGSNYDIFKPKTDEGNSVAFAIEKIKLESCLINYQHSPSQFVYASNMENGKARLDFREGVTEVSLTGNMHADSIKQKQDYYLKDQAIAITSSIRLIDDNKKLIINPSELMIADVLLNTEGRVNIGESTDLDISFSNQEATLTAISSILPSYIQSSLSHLELGGKGEISGKFVGQIDATHNPSFELDYNITEGALSSLEQDFKLENIGAKGSLKIPNLGDLTSAWVQCQLNKAQSGSNVVRGDLHIDNFKVPLIKWEGHAALDAPTLVGLMDQKNLQLNKGHLSLKGKMQLRYNAERQEVVPRSFKYLGTLKAQNLRGTITDPKIQLHDADFEFTANDRHVVIKDCKLQYNESTAELAGYILNANELFNKNSNTEISGRLDYNNLNINDFIPSQSSDTTDTKINKTIFPYKLALKTSIQNFHYNDFTAESVKGTLYSNRRSIRLDQGEVKALRGTAQAKLTFGTIGDYYILDINSRLNGIDIKELFSQFNNFDQAEITSDNLSGDLSGTITAKVLFDAQFNALTDKLYSKAEVEISNGQLINYEPLQSLSNFVEVDELKNVKFTTLRNTIEIFDQTIFIPKMHIGNSAMSLDLEGTHSFENVMNYQISVKLAEVLARQSNWFARRVERNLTENADGGLTAHIRMKGTPDDLKISYDRISVTDVVQDELDEERRNFIDVINGQYEEEVSDDYYDDIWDE